MHQLRVREIVGRRDLTVGSYPLAVPTYEEDEIIPFFRYETITGRLGATLLTDLVHGPWQLPRATSTTGVAPVPAGILNLPVNPANTYAYNARSPNVTFGGPASWATVVQFEATLEAGREALLRRCREGYGDPAKAEAERQALLQIIETME